MSGGRTPRLAGARRGVDRLLAAVLVTLLLAMTADVLWQVISRFLLANPSSVTEELARYLLVWLGLLGGAYAYGQGSHPAVEGGLGRVWSAGGGRWAARVAVAVFALAVLIVGGANLVRLTFALRQTSAALGLALGWVYLALPISGLLLVFYALTGPPDAAAGDAEMARPGGAADVD